MYVRADTAINCGFPRRRAMPRACLIAFLAAAVSYTRLPGSDVGGSPAPAEAVADLAPLLLGPRAAGDGADEEVDLELGREERQAGKALLDDVHGLVQR